MKPVFLSTCFSIIASSIIGSVLFSALVHIYDLSLKLPPLLIGGVVFSILVNICFFFIRRWDGCIEKLGGLNFSLCLFLAATMPIVVFQSLIPEDIRCLLWTHFSILFFQFVGIGMISTHFLRTQNYSPPKPGEPFCW